MPLPTGDTLLLLHHPRCSKSRGLKAALDERGVEYDVRLYVEAPLTREELLELERRLDRPLAQVVRAKDAAEAGLDLGPQATREEVVAALLAHPALLERPILVRGKSAAIGRPLEAALELLDP